MMQTILGSGGAIAEPLAEELIKYTDKIRLVSRNPKKVNLNDELMAADLTQAAEVDKAVSGSDIVYLMVGYTYKAKIWAVEWPKTMRNVIDACKKYHCKLVFFDNVYMYDPTKVGHMTEQTPWKPSSKKGKIRAETAKMLMDEINAGQIRAIIARSADFYGPNTKNGVLNVTVFNNFKKGKPAQWLGSTSKRHTFTYTVDAAKATALLANTEDAYNQVWHLPTYDTQMTGKDWVTQIAKEMNISPKIQLLPVWMMGILGLFVLGLTELKEMVYQYTQDYYFDSNKFTKRFGSMITPPELGIKEVVESMK
ncbi:MAG: NAD-dependent epimerase/dehydratase family protein [Bacteroidota bacterium]|nr:NAD-dependent epimerase/dehydratase family protein [Bacteroidota bacterium]